MHSGLGILRAAASVYGLRKGTAVTDDNDILQRRAQKLRARISGLKAYLKDLREESRGSAYYLDREYRRDAEDRLERAEFELAGVRVELIAEVEQYEGLLEIARQGLALSEESVALAALEGE